MRRKKIKLSYGKENFEINLRVCSSIGKVVGLMFSRRENAKALLFEFNEPTNMSIHSWFVFFPFIAIWMDEKGKIVGVKVVRPFQAVIRPVNKFVKLIEIPLNKKYARIVKALVGDRNL